MRHFLINYLICSSWLCLDASADKAAGSSASQEDAVSSLLDTLDDSTEEKHKPASVPSWIYAVLTPLLGGILFSLSFPVLWFNERRASRRKEKKPQPLSQGESQAMLSSDTMADAYDAKVEAWEKHLCSSFCCCSERLKARFDDLPDLDGSWGDSRTHFFRILGFFMMFGGLDLMLSPLYFMLHSLWFFGALIAGHLAVCICKASCSLYGGTVAGSYAIHRPLAVAGVLAALALCIAAVIYFKTSVSSK
mmetsp:Transcript_22653/g.40962  ORF Transcript_22653/g.40962 Transcript_22653/m.40962 type:complete len:249 (-) Transcript_22653:151-897(-)